MVHVSGLARIKHAETGEIYEIDSDMIEFDAVGSVERQMGPEIWYSADIHHPQLGEINWSFWEYPVGAENYRKTDVGIHEILEDFEIEIEHDPEEYDDRQIRTDALVNWFHERYDDPAHRLPHDSREGGYQWIYGGPFDAREELEENFPDEDENIIQAAVEEIESDGLVDWAPVQSPDDYDEDREESKSLGDLIQELDIFAAEVPVTPSFPIFKFGADGVLHMMAPFNETSVSDKILLEELRDVTGELRKSLSGTNAHLDLLEMVNKYELALLSDPVSISRLYALGIRLDNVSLSTNESITAENLPPLPAKAFSHLNSTLELHRTYIMANEEGCRLAQGADAYLQTSEQASVLKHAAKHLATSVEQSPTLFAEEIRQYISEVVNDIGKGPQPKRSNQTAVMSFANMFSGLLKGVSKLGSFTVATIASTVISTSEPAVAAVTEGTAIINAVWSFLIDNLPSLLVLAASTSEYPWLVFLCHLLSRIQARM